MLDSVQLFSFLDVLIKMKLKIHLFKFDFKLS